MKKVICLLLTLTMFCGIAEPVFAENEDVPAGYTPIRTAQELDNIRNNLSGKYILMSDIDLGGFENWVPIGTKETPFTGIIDGKLRTITGLNITDIRENKYAGLFGCAEGAEIKGIIINGLIDLKTDNVTAAGVCGYSFESIISECVNNVNIVLKSKEKGEFLISGGVAGYLSGSSLAECVNCGNITIDFHCKEQNNNYGTITGGILGKAYDSQISDCRNSGNITVKDNNKYTATGGILGLLQGNTGLGEKPGKYYLSLHNTCNTGNVSATSDKGGNPVAGDISVIDWCTEDLNEPKLVSGCYYLDTSCETELSGYYADDFKPFNKSEMNKKGTFAEFDFDKVWAMSLAAEMPVLRFEEKATAINLNSIVRIFLKIIQWFVKLFGISKNTI
ncbi:MAG: hypothetical protein IJK60_09135 [Clostridia bacterium]|nr:hypothetical protein [Clostridia bacterium]